MSNPTFKALIEDYFAKHYAELMPPARWLVDTLKKEHQAPRGGKIVIITNPSLGPNEFFLRDSRNANPGWEVVKVKPDPEFRQEYECRPWTRDEEIDQVRLYRDAEHQRIYAKARKP